MTAGLETLKVLLVEDNHHMRAIVVAVLKGIGLTQVREAHDGAEALNVLREWPADLAIIDYEMQPLDGADFTRLVRNAPDSGNPFLPIIMMTGHSDRVRVLEARDAGVTEVLVKPLTTKAVLDRLNAVIYKPRNFVRTEDYFGPDRRRRDDPHYEGPRRRKSDAEAAAQANPAEALAKIMAAVKL